MNGKSVKYFNSNTKWSIGVFAKCIKNKKIKKRFKINLNSADLIRILAQEQFDGLGQDGGK